MQLFFLNILPVFTLILKEVFGHGMMLDPPNRSSLWRFDSSAPPNYSDNQNWCGGFAVQFNEENGGRCGVCGDTFTDPHPQANENTGTYGQGKVVAHYDSGSVIEVNILLTANHRGKFTYSLCQLQNPDAPESGEDCFKPLQLEDWSWEYNVNSEDKTVKNKIRLPEMSCNRCVLRWVYTAGNNWGDCGDGHSALGCGNQEHFMSCSDISIG